VSCGPAFGLDGEELPLDDMAGADGEAAVGDPAADRAVGHLGDGRGLVEWDQLGEFVVRIEAHALIVPGRGLPGSADHVAVILTMSRGSIRCALNA